MMKERQTTNDRNSFGRLPTNLATKSGQIATTHPTRLNQDPAVIPSSAKPGDHTTQAMTMTLIRSSAKPGDRTTQAMTMTL